MINSGLKEISDNVVNECRRQWQQRKAYQEVESKKQLEKRINWLRCVPNTWYTLVNAQSTNCKKCKKIGVIGTG